MSTILSPDGLLMFRHLYVESTVAVGTQVKVGDIIGYAQDVRKIYPNAVGMQVHVHQDCSLGGERVNAKKDSRFVVVDYSPR